MQLKGTIVEWNDDRGFGFIEPSGGGSKVFCHIKAFAIRVRRPMAGDSVTYRTVKDAQGRLQAADVRPVGLEGAAYNSNVATRRTAEPRVKPAEHTRRARGAGRRNPLGAAFSIFVVGAIGFAAYESYISHRNSGGDAALSAPQPAQSDSRQFKCDGRTHCSQMTSCAEATYFLEHCPGTQMDGNNDGEPCEQQWCN